MAQLLTACSYATTEKQSPTLNIICGKSAHSLQLVQLELVNELVGYCEL